MYVAVNYEEKELMKAEALINRNQIDAGLAKVDAICTAQGAGLTAVSVTGLSLAQAKEELRRERRIVLLCADCLFIIPVVGALVNLQVQAAVARALYC